MGLVTAFKTAMIAIIKAMTTKMPSIPSPISFNEFQKSAIWMAQSSCGIVLHPLSYSMPGTSAKMMPPAITEPI